MNTQIEVRDDVNLTAILCLEVDHHQQHALSPVEVRAIILRQHTQIRGLLALIDDKATSLLAASVPNALEREATRQLALVLCAVMTAHIELENRILVTALMDVDAWGPVRAEQLRAEHREQLIMVQAYAKALARESPTGAVLGLTASRLVELIAADMEHEEASVLSADLLCDETIGSDVETG